MNRIRRFWRRRARESLEQLDQHLEVRGQFRFGPGEVFAGKDPGGDDRHPEFAGPLEEVLEPSHARPIALGVRPQARFPGVATMSVEDDADVVGKTVGVERRTRRRS